MEKNSVEKLPLNNRKILNPTKAMVNSIKERTGEVMGDSLSCINTPLNTLNKEAVNAARIPSKMPSPYFISTEKIRQIAAMIIKPISNS